MNKARRSITVNYYKTPDNLPLVVIVEDGLFPCCIWLNAYLNCDHASTLNNAKSKGSISFNTRRTYANELRFLYCHFKDKDIDLVERVSDGNFLSIEEIDDYVRVSKFYSDNESESRDKKVVSLSDRRIQEAIHATSYSAPEVSTHTYKQRLNRLRSYIEYLYVRHHYDKADTEHKALIDNQFIKLDIYLKGCIAASRKDNAKTRDALESVIPDDKFFKLLEVMKESSHENPFRGSKLRNQIITQILIETGVRIGAVAKLKISDLVDDWDNPRFLNTRTPNDPTDPRRIPAANKTKALSVPISHELMKLIKLYIKTTRAAMPHSHSHDFIFVSEKGKTAGKPITYNGLDKLTKTLGKAAGIELHPHLLRHKWNEIFETKATALGYSADKIEDLRKYSMGWVENSTMASVYNEYKLAVTVSEISSKNQSKSVPKLRNNHD